MQTNTKPRGEETFLVLTPFPKGDGLLLLSCETQASTRPPRALSWNHPLLSVNLAVTVVSVHNGLIISLKNNQRETYVCKQTTISR